MPADARERPRRSPRKSRVLGCREGTHRSHRTGSPLLEGDPMNRLGEVDGVFTRNDVLRLRHGCRVVLEQLCASQRGRTRRGGPRFSSMKSRNKTREREFARSEVRASRSAGLGFWLFSIDSDGGILRNSQYSNSLQKRIIRSRGYNRESDSRPQKERTTRVFYSPWVCSNVRRRASRGTTTRARGTAFARRAPPSSCPRVGCTRATEPQAARGGGVGLTRVAKRAASDVLSGGRVRDLLVTGV
jgi:hypothetical protein